MVTWGGVESSARRGRHFVSNARRVFRPYQQTALPLAIYPAPTGGGAWFGRLTQSEAAGICVRRPRYSTPDTYDRAWSKNSILHRYAPSPSVRQHTDSPPGRQYARSGKNPL